MMQFQSLMDIKNAVFEARQAALREARESCGRGYIPSRGTFLGTAGGGCQCAPQPSAECANWTGTWVEIEKLVELVKRDHPRVEEITISGGYDHATSVQAHKDGDYTPWAGSWEVLVWRRERRADGSSWGAEPGAPL